MEKPFPQILQPIANQKPTLGLILGSGLNSIADRIDQALAIPYSDIPGFKASTAPGHRGQLICGQLAGQTILAMQGRLHYYEGYDLADVVYPIRLMHQLGIKTLIVSNAAGGINERFSVGDLMLITDHINFTGNNALIGPAAEGELRFPDMTYAYAPALRDKVRQAADRLKMPLQEGVYVAISGPSYETPAEIRAFRILGGDAVGMSTVHEVTAANALQMQVIGISCIANLAAGILPDRLTEEDVLQAGKAVEEKFSNLIIETIKDLEG